MSHVIAAALAVSTAVESYRVTGLWALPLFVVLSCVAAFCSGNRYQIWLRDGR